MKNVIELPSVITKDSWFYKDNKELCEPHLNKPYVSYSTVDSWETYREDWIKQKFVGLELPSGVYAELGSYLGEAVETGEFGDNPKGFTGQENFELIDRPENAEYEKMILIDLGDFVVIGFIDILKHVGENEVEVWDLKTGGSKKEKKYEGEDYIQVILYAHALAIKGFIIKKTGIWFVRRTGSHVNPPLHISDEQFPIDLPFTEERVKFALDRVKRVAGEISDCYKVYKKIFLN